MVNVKTFSFTEYNGEVSLTLSQVADMCEFLRLSVGLIISPSANQSDCTKALSFYTYTRNGKTLRDGHKIETRIEQHVGEPIPQFSVWVTPYEFTEYVKDDPFEGRTYTNVAIHFYGRSLLHATLAAICRLVTEEGF